MIIDKPLEWQRKLDETNALMDKRNAELFWNTVKEFDFQTLNAHSPELTEIYLLVNEDEDYEYYLKLQSNASTSNSDEKHFEVTYIQKGKNAYYLQKLKNEKLVPFITENLNIISNFSFVTPFSKLTFKLKNGLGMELSINPRDTYILFQFVEIKE